MSAVHPRIGVLVVLTAALAWATPAVGQASVEADGRSAIGRTFFRGVTGTAAQRARAHGWGVPRLESLRGDHRPQPERSTVPVNVGSLANGTANAPAPRRPDPRRSPLPLVLPPTYVQVNNHVTVVTGAGAPERTRAIRNVDVARARAEARASRRGSRPAPTPPSAAPGDEPVHRTGIRSAPLVEPLVAPPLDGSLDRRDCVTLRITTPGGIEWRHEVALGTLGATSVTGAASLLQDRLRRGEPLSVRSEKGGFTVPAAQVESLIVGPCR